MRRADSLEMTLMLGKTEGGRRRGRLRVRWLDGIDLMDMSLSKWRSEWRSGKPGALRSMGSQSRTQLKDWTTAMTKHGGRTEACSSPLRWGASPADPSLPRLYQETYARGTQHAAFFFLIVVDFVIHWNESAMGLRVFPIPIPPPTSLSTCSL